MAVYSITQIAGTQEQAERAVMGILTDIVDIPGVGEPEIATEKDGKVFLAVATIVIPDDIQLDEVQRDKLERYTNLDEKSEEFVANFEDAEEGDDQTPQDPIIAAAATSDRINDMTPEVPAMDETDSVSTQQTVRNDAEGDIQVAENDIGNLVPDPAPEMQEETVLAAGASEDKEKDREREKVYAQKADEQNLTQDKPSPDRMEKEKDPKLKQDNEPELA